MRQIILDTETTGLNPHEGHRVIEIGCVELVNRRLTGNHFHCYINPEREIDVGALRVHGISEAFLKDKPLFSDIAPDLVDYIQGAEIIIHNAPFDVGFLNAELRRLTNYQIIERYCLKIIDSLAISRKKHPGQQNSLDALCKRYHIDNSNRDLHGALLDAELLAQVYLAMTGGQAQLFKENNSGRRNQKVTLEVSALPAVDLPVVYANAHEMTQHQTQIKAYKNLETQVWWDDTNNG